MSTYAIALTTFDAHDVIAAIWELTRASGKTALSVVHHDGFVRRLEMDEATLALLATLDDHTIGHVDTDGKRETMLTRYGRVPLDTIAAVRCPTCLAQV